MEIILSDAEPSGAIVQRLDMDETLAALDALRVVYRDPAAPTLDRHALGAALRKITSLIGDDAYGLEIRVTTGPILTPHR